MAVRVTWILGNSTRNMGQPDYSLLQSDGSSPGLNPPLLGEAKFKTRALLIVLAVLCFLEALALIWLAQTTEAKDFSTTLMGETD
jgi:hypothetical protein